MTDRISPALLRLLQLTSPTLPVGAYAYSGGLEHAVNAGWIRHEQACQAWIIGVMEHSLAGLDLPLLHRLHQAWTRDDTEAVHYWSKFLKACRESAEQGAEDHQLGTAMARLLADLGIEEARAWIAAAHCNWAAMFSLAALRWDIAEQHMLQGYLWSWCENQVAAAIKLLPLGQTAGQRILLTCGEHIPACAQGATALTDEELGYGAPALAIGSALHEEQYSRLFRS